MLKAENISVRLGRTPILKGVGYTAAPGQVSAIVGPNGSGKSTLLKAITGDIPFDGSVTLNGYDTASLRPWELSRMRAVLPQASVLAFPFTVLEVVQIGLQAGSEAQVSIPLQALACVGLTHYANRFYQELSGGEQQRVQLARVLSQVWSPIDDGGPRWLFLDEPVSALDIAHQLQVMQIARDFASAGGGVIAIMHDLNLTAMFADQVTILSGGAVLATGTPKQVMCDDVLSRAYDWPVRVGRVPAPDIPFVLPHAAETAQHQTTTEVS